MTTTEILKQCTISGNIIQLPTVQLDRKQYLEIKKQLEFIGGKWKGGNTQGFVFPTDPTDLLAQITASEDRNLKKEYQFFATPDSLADYLVELSEIKNKDIVLEPSAGRGAIVNAIHREFPAMDVFGYEIMDINQSFLAKIDHFKLLGSDFLAECNTFFDVIVANPPFAKNQDIDHIRKMFECLKPGGRLVTIASKHWQFAEGKKERLFCEWIEKVEADVYDVDRGEFKESGTMVETCIIVIQN